MASTYTTNLGIEKIGTGEQSGTWGDTTNTNFDILDEAVNGIISITLSSAGSSGSPNSLPITDGASSNGRNKFIEFVDGGDLGGTAYVQLTPNDAEKIVHIRNSLSSSRSIIVFQGTYSASNDFEIANGADVLLKFNGGGSGATVTDVNVDLTVTGATIATADINGGAIDGTVIGGSTAAAGTFTTFTSTGIDDNATSTAITIDSSERVGIGTTSPADELHVNAASANVNLRLTRDTNTGARISGSDGASTPVLKFDTIASGTATERMRIDGSGNVGIGTTSPDTPLHVLTNSSGYAITIEENSGTEAFQIGVDSVGSLDFFNTKAGTSHLSLVDNGDTIVTGGGNVGIGTASPNFSLEVQGSSNQVISIQTTGTTDNTQLRFGDADNSDQGKVNYDHSVDAMTLHTSDAERVRIDSSGNVGIGTATVNRKLELAGNNNAGAKANYLRITDTDTTATADNQQGGIEFYASDSSAGAGVTASIEVLYAGSGGGGEITFNTAANSGAGVSEAMRIDESGGVIFKGSLASHQTNAGVFEYSSNLTSIHSYGATSGTGQMRFLTGGGGGSGTSEAMRINSSGKVGIGNTSPTRTLDLGNGTATANAEINSSSAPNFLFSRADVEVGYIGTTLWNTGSGSDTELSIRGKTAVGFVIGSSEKARIDSSGNLLVGTTTSGSSRFVASKSVATGVYTTKIIDTNTTAANCFGINIDYSAAAPNGSGNQFIYCEDSSALRMSVTSNGGISNYQAYDSNLSDQRAKKDIVESGNYLEKLCNIPVKNFRYEEDAENSKHHLGVIAQEVEAVAPEFVNKAAWDYKGEKLDTVYNNDVMFAMLKAMQELSAQVTELKAEVAALKGE